MLPYRDLVDGSRIGAWCVEGELGRGGHAVVYAVTHVQIGKRAAVKVLSGSWSAAAAERLVLEAQIANRLRHPGVVDVFDHGVLDDGRPYLVMERLDGSTLAAQMAGRKLAPDVVIAIAIQICEVLAAAHAAGIVHRDLKPENVFLVDGPTPQVKVLDWGIARILEEQGRRTVVGHMMGTPRYLTPEQVCGHAGSPKTDVYALGLLAFEMLFEDHPFDAPTSVELLHLTVYAPPPVPRELWPSIPPALDALLLAMLAKEPAQRPTIAAVATTLTAVREALASRRTRPMPVIVAPRMRPPVHEARPRHLRVPIALAIGGFAFVFAAQFAMPSGRATHKPAPPVISAPKPPPAIVKPVAKPSPR